MSLMGIDVGTTGCKAAVFTTQGEMLAFAYEEYDVQRPQPGWAELNASEVWGKVRRVIHQAASQCGYDPVVSLSVSSLAEAVVPVSTSRQILGASILNWDVRGDTYLPELSSRMSDERLYQINGNTWGNHFGLTKLMWLRDNQPKIYEQADYFLPWGSFVSFMLGSEAVVDYSLANRLLLFDLDRQEWSPEILACSGLDRSKLPRLMASGSIIGQVERRLAEELGLSQTVAITTGAHDQCASATGCGAVRPGVCMFGMGTFLCFTPVFDQRQNAVYMIRGGLNTENHAVPGQFVSFLYNQGGSLLKWYRDTFAALEHRQAQQTGRDIYADLIGEIPTSPSKVIVLPHFAVTGPPSFIADSSGVIVGLKLETSRSEILKGILEGTAYYIKECMEGLPEAGIAVTELRATGGGSKSDAWIQLCADIFECPIVRPSVPEAGALGAAMIAGLGVGLFKDYSAAVAAMVHLERQFDPDPQRSLGYLENYRSYRQLWPALSGVLRGGRNGA